MPCIRVLLWYADVGCLASPKFSTVEIGFTTFTMQVQWVRYANRVLTALHRPMGPPRNVYIIRRMYGIAIVYYVWCTVAISQVNISAQMDKFWGFLLVYYVTSKMTGQRASSPETHFQHLWHDCLQHLTPFAMTLPYSRSGLKKRSKMAVNWSVDFQLFGSMTQACYTFIPHCPAHLSCNCQSMSV